MILEIPATILLPYRRILSDMKQSGGKVKDAREQSPDAIVSWMQQEVWFLVFSLNTFLSLDLESVLACTAP